VEDPWRIQVKLVQKERIRVDGFDVVTQERGGWEVADVRRHQDSGSSSDGSSEHVSILWMIGHRRCQVFIVLDAREREGASHLPHATLGLLRALAEGRHKVSFNFDEHILRPQWSIHVRLSQP